MLEESNGLNDILLDKSSNNSSTKKVVLAVAVLLIVAIIVIVLMKSLSSDQSSNNNLPQAALPPEPKESVVDDPLFEPVDVIDENTKDDSSLDKIAQKLKQESLEENSKVADTKEESTEKTAEVTEKSEKIEKSEKTDKKSKANEEVPTPEFPETKAKVKTPSKAEAPTKTTDAPTITGTSGSVSYYIQVGSFSKHEPDSKFVKKITDNGYEFVYQKVNVGGKTINKILIGPFKREKDARDVINDVRAKIIPSAFITKV